MIYAAFTLWLLLILLTGIGVYTLWTRMLRATWVNWALFPGTLVSEMAYVFGCLITGGEIRRAKITPSRSDRHGQSGGPTTEAAGGLKGVRPLVASFLAVVACGGAILGVQALLGQAVIAKFTGPSIAAWQLPQTLPTSAAAFWSQLHLQVDILHRMCTTLTELTWSNWQVPVFVYLGVCLSVRLGPVGRDLRAALAAVVVIALLIALIGAVSSGFAGLMNDVWPLLSYVWASLLLLLTATLAIRGVVALMRVLQGKKVKSGR